MPDGIYSVSQITRYIKSLLQSDIMLQDVWVEGEVSNLTLAASGHCYFTLKDGAAVLTCIMWRNQVEMLGRLPKDNETVEAHGTVSVYEARGQYQLIVDTMRPFGVGRLYLMFEELKAKLAAEGLFDEERKRPLPARPQRIGVVTSPTAAALQDILRTLSQRFPLVEVLLAPSQVQGEGAPPQISQAIAALNGWSEPVDVIIVARGGGSVEELWAFNDEQVARAIANSRIPIISGVGHESDFTIADFVADVRAPTPTGAAAAAVPDRITLMGEVRGLAYRLAEITQNQVERLQTEVENETHALQRLSPQGQVMTARQRVDDLTRTATTAISHPLALRRSRLQGLTAQIASLSPLEVLNRGYALVHRQKDGQLIRQVVQATPGEKIRVRVSDGEFTGTVNEI